MRVYFAEEEGGLGEKVVNLKLQFTHTTKNGSGIFFSLFQWWQFPLCSSVKRILIPHFDTACLLHIDTSVVGSTQVFVWGLPHFCLWSKRWGSVTRFSLGRLKCQPQNQYITTKMEFPLYIQQICLDRLVSSVCLVLIQSLDWKGNKVWNFTTNWSNLTYRTRPNEMILLFLPYFFPICIASSSFLEYCSWALEFFSGFCLSEFTFRFRTRILLGCRS